MSAGVTFLAVARELFLRDLSRLEDEVRAYAREEDLWVLRGEAPNRGGNLALHLVGNLRYYVGSVLGGEPYLRDREGEFSRRDVPREELLALIRETRSVVDRTLDGLSPEVLEEPFPDPPERFRGRSTAFFLAHLLTHLAYHLGQVNYHRRLLADDG